MTICPPVQADTVLARADARFRARLERDVELSPGLDTSPAVAALMAASDAPSLLEEAHDTARFLTAAGPSKVGSNLVLEAAAAARGLRCWDALAKALRKHGSGRAVPTFPVAEAYQVGASPDIDAALHAEGIYPHADRTWTEIATYLQLSRQTHVQARASSAWRQVHPGGWEGFVKFVDEALRAGCILSGERVLGCTWTLAEPGGQVLSVNQALVWWMAERRLIHLPPRNEISSNWNGRAYPAPRPHAWRGQRLIGEPENRVDALLWLEARHSHASNQRSDARRTHERARAYQLRLTQVQASTPCPACSGGEDQHLMPRICDDCQGSGYRYDG